MPNNTKVMHNNNNTNNNGKTPVGSSTIEKTGKMQSISNRLSGERRAKLIIKKAHVRFDDYLDLNEESLRRSCKRLMHHLYEPNLNSNINMNSNFESTPSSSLNGHSNLQGSAIANTKLMASSGSRMLASPSCSPSSDNSNSSSCMSSAPSYSSCAGIAAPATITRSKSPPPPPASSSESQASCTNCSLGAGEQHIDGFDCYPPEDGNRNDGYERDDGDHVAENDAPTDSILLTKPDQQNKTAPLTARVTSSPKRPELENKTMLSKLNKSETITRSTSTPVSLAQVSNSKSYLKSQYERRQQRQLELCSLRDCRMQHVTRSNHAIATGANIARPKRFHRHQEPDLMVESHELSKKKFFEKLEQREFCKKKQQQNQHQEAKFESNSQSSSTCNQEFSIAQERDTRDINKLIGDDQFACRAKSSQQKKTNSNKIINQQEIKPECPVQKGFDYKRRRKPLVLVAGSGQRATTTTNKITTARTTSSIDGLVRNSGHNDRQPSLGDLIKICTSKISEQKQQKDSSDSHDDVVTVDDHDNHRRSASLANTIECNQLEENNSSSLRNGGQMLMAANHMDPMDCYSDCYAQNSSSLFEIQVPERSNCELSVDSLAGHQLFVSSELSDRNISGLIVKQVEAAIEPPSGPKEAADTNANTGAAGATVHSNCDFRSKSESSSDLELESASKLITEFKSTQERGNKFDDRRFRTIRRFSSNSVEQINSNSLDGGSINQRKEAAEIVGTSASCASGLVEPQHHNIIGASASEALNKMPANYDDHDFCDGQIRNDYHPTIERPSNSATISRELTRAELAAIELENYQRQQHQPDANIKTRRAAGQRLRAKSLDKLQQLAKLGTTDLATKANEALCVGSSLVLRRLQGQQPQVDQEKTKPHSPVASDDRVARNHEASPETLALCRSNSIGQSVGFDCPTRDSGLRAHHFKSRSALHLDLNLNSNSNTKSTQSRALAIAMREEDTKSGLLIRANQTEEEAAQRPVQIPLASAGLPEQTLKIAQITKSAQIGRDHSAEPTGQRLPEEPEATTGGGGAINRASGLLVVSNAIEKAPSDGSCLRASKQCNKFAFEQADDVQQQQQQQQRQHQVASESSKIIEKFEHDHDEHDQIKCSDQVADDKTERGAILAYEYYGYANPLSAPVTDEPGFASTENPYGRLTHKVRTYRDEREPSLVSLETKVVCGRDHRLVTSEISPAFGYTSIEESVSCARPLLIETFDGVGLASAGEPGVRTTTTSIGQTTTMKRLVDEDRRSSCSSSGFGASSSSDGCAGSISDPQQARNSSRLGPSTLSSEVTSISSKLSDANSTALYANTRSALDRVSASSSCLLLAANDKSNATTTTSTSTTIPAIYNIVRNQQIRNNVQMRPMHLQVASETSSNVDYANDRDADHDGNGSCCYAQVVGPEQAYPIARNYVLVENHNYDSMVRLNQHKSRTQLQQSGRGNINSSYQKFDNKTSKSDYTRANYFKNNHNCDYDHYAPSYANLRPSNGKSCVSPQPSCGNNDIYAKIMVKPLASNNTNNKSSKQQSSSVSSELRSSCNSLGSGGFSMLPPVKVLASESTITTNNDNNANLTNSCGKSEHNDEPTAASTTSSSNKNARNSSILKRFGSLLSKKFLSSSNDATNANVSPKTFAPDKEHAIEREFGEEDEESTKPHQPIESQSSAMKLKKSIDLNGSKDSKPNADSKTGRQNHENLPLDLGINRIETRERKDDFFEMENKGTIIGNIGNNLANSCKQHQHQHSKLSVQTRNLNGADLVILPSKSQQVAGLNLHLRKHQTQSTNYQSSSRRCSRHGQKAQNQQQPHQNHRRQHDRSRLASRKLIDGRRRRPLDKWSSQTASSCSSWSSWSASSAASSLCSTSSWSVISESKLRSKSERTKLKLKSKSKSRKSSPNSSSCKRRSSVHHSHDLDEELESLVSKAGYGDEVIFVTAEVNFQNCQKMGGSAFESSKLKFGSQLDKRRPISGSSQLMADERDVLRLDDEHEMAKYETFERNLNQNNLFLDQRPLEADAIINMQSSNKTSIEGEAKTSAESNLSPVDSHANENKPEIAVVDDDDDDEGRIQNHGKDFSRRRNSSKNRSENLNKTSNEYNYGYSRPKGLKDCATYKHSRQHRVDSTDGASKSRDALEYDIKLVDVTRRSNSHEHSHNHRRRHHAHRDRHDCHNRRKSNGHSHHHSQYHYGHHNDVKRHTLEPGKCSLVSNSTSIESSANKTNNHNKGGVWGQLISIDKSDGSQVIELHRHPDCSWGFHVSRGAIDKTKGIFVSRMHDHTQSMVGLLSIGDRIIAIDRRPIDSYDTEDITRLHRLINERSKLRLKVKPFTG